jgi:hypothetical protein
MTERRRWTRGEWLRLATGVKRIKLAAGMIPERFRRRQEDDPEIRFREFFEGEREDDN